MYATRKSGGTRRDRILYETMMINREVDRLRRCPRQATRKWPRRGRPLPIIGILRS